MTSTLPGDYALPVRWIALEPGFVRLWQVEQVDIDGWFVTALDHVEEPVHVLRVLLGEADPVGLAEFDRLHHEGWGEDPPNWTGERLRAFSAAAGRLPDPRGPVHGYWELPDDVVVELAPKLPWSKQFADGPVAEARESIQLEWSGARRLHRFLAEAVAAGNDVVAN